MRMFRHTIPLVALALCWSLTTYSRPDAPSLVFDHAALHVSDLARSASFYEKLGLRRIADPFKDDRHVWLGMGPGRELHLIADGRENPQADIDVHIAMRVPSLPALVKRLEQLKIPYYNTRREPNSITKRPDGVMQVYIQDPDGNWLELNDVKP
jgi:lactoylglutathione lyase